ncbi:helix-turn-helix domain-containing protein [Gordonia McavH-238-E]|uniref:helix-turn-helix domain-containing protein n=1 Tax=Gordonia sp. McavH-238-E TaxID=2917736 RepID=UPI001EF4B6E5|nr:helix-turn-helix domain-containing protein [Gordonia sp. McavH-238-E]MCG7631445.1 helix-turn-helix domain-containing protein [Gordonia sp. McavH-238-E]
MRPVTSNPQLEAVVDHGVDRLSWKGRCRIEDLVTAHYHPAQIARLMGRARSTISRELARGVPIDRASRYRALVAQNRAEAARRRPK